MRVTALIRNSIFRVVISWMTIGSFMLPAILMPGLVQAQDMAPGTMVALNSFVEPALLKGIRLYADDPFRLDFVLDKGDARSSSKDLKDESARLVRYFFAALTIPEKDLWVNLSPYERGRIIPPAFGQTEIGRDLLSQDYILKQITAAVIYPGTPFGRKFWDKVYAGIYARYGTGDVSVDTFNKVWIVPEKAILYDNERSAYVIDSHLKVMLETDYTATANSQLSMEGSSVMSPAADISRQIMREVVLPAIEQEVNQGRNFVQLRQIYHSLILAIWFKDKIRTSLLGKAYVDQNKVSGVDIRDKAAAEKIWRQYAEDFRKGAYNYIREEFNPEQDQVVSRKYFSGGIIAERTRSVIERRYNADSLSQIKIDNAMLVRAAFEPVDSVSGHPAQKSVSGFLFKPRDEIIRDDQKSYQGTRSSSQIQEIFQNLEENGKKLQMRLPVRAFDGPGSGLDRKERRDMITAKGSFLLESISITPAFAHRDLYMDVTIEAADDPETTVYVAPDYGYPENAPYVVRGGLSGKSFPLGMSSAPAYIFSDLFGIKGVKVTLAVSHPVILAGGVESSSGFLGACLMLASMLKGTDWSLADIYYRERDIENRIFGGAAGGQGLFAAFLGGVHENSWLSSLTNDKGIPVFGDEVFSHQMIVPKDYPFFEERMAFIQLGKGFENGSSVDQRTAELTNIMGRDLLLDQDPVAIRLYQERLTLAHQFAQAVASREMRTAIGTVNRYMEIRDELNYRWFEIAMMPDGSPGKPRYAKQYAEFLEQNPVLKGLREKHGESLKRISLYSYASGHMMVSAKNHGIGLFMVGTGGSKMNAVAIAETPEALQSFLAENQISLFTIDEAWKAVRTGGVLKGYLPFHIGGALEFGKEFEEYGLILPQGPAAARLNEVQGGISVTPVVADTSERARDIRFGIVHELKQELGDKYNIQIGGAGSIDISSGSFNKGDVVNRIFEADADLKVLLYFGNEFDVTGNDSAIAAQKRILGNKGKALIIFSVDPKPENRTQEAIKETLWIGSGPEASERVMKEIAEALSSGKKNIIIRGMGMDVHKSVVLDLEELKNTGRMLFDVDGTLLLKKEDDLLPEHGIGKEFARLLGMIPLGILSGHSRIMQTERISDQLKGSVHMSRLFLYVNGGRTLVRFDESGRESMEFLALPIEESDIIKIRKVFARLALSNFGMNERELKALKKWLNFNGTHGDMTAYDSRRFQKRIQFSPWWMLDSFQPDVVTDLELKAIQGSDGNYVLTEPYLIVKDGVQVTISLFPKELPLDPDDAQKADAPGGIDLTAQRVRSSAEKHIYFPSRQQKDVSQPTGIVEVSHVVRQNEDGMRIISSKDSGVADRIRNGSGLRPVIMSITPMPVALCDFL